MLPEGSHLHKEDFSWFILNNTPQFSRNTLGIARGAVRTGSEWRPISGGNDFKVSIIDKKLVFEFEGSDDAIWDLKNSSALYARCNCVFFPQHELGLSFQTVDERVYFTEMLHRSQITCLLGAIPPSLTNHLETLLPKNPLLYVFNMVAVKHIVGVKRGARVKSIAIASQYPWVHIFKPMLLLTLDSFFKDPQEHILANLYKVINSTDSSLIPMLTRFEKKSLRMALCNRLTHYDPDFVKCMDKLRFYDEADKQLELLRIPTEIEVLMPFMNVNLPLKIPLLAYEGEIGAVLISVNT